VPPLPSLAGGASKRRSRSPPEGGRGGCREREVAGSLANPCAYAESFVRPVSTLGFQRGDIARRCSQHEENDASPSDSEAASVTACERSRKSPWCCSQ